MELIDDGGLADPGISGDEHQLWRTARYDALKGGKQSIDLGCAPIQFLRNQQPVWGVVFAQGELVDASLSFPCSKAAPKITLSARRCLVAFLGRFGEQLHDDCRYRCWRIFRSLVRRNWLSRDMAVHPFHRVGSREGKAPGQDFV
jgi:hypothetical protein